MGFCSFQPLVSRHFLYAWSQGCPFTGGLTVVVVKWRHNENGLLVACRLADMGHGLWYKLLSHELSQLGYARFLAMGVWVCPVILVAERIMGALNTHGWKLRLAVDLLLTKPKVACCSMF